MALQFFTCSALLNLEEISFRKYSSSAGGTSFSVVNPSSPSLPGIRNLDGKRRISGSPLEDDDPGVLVAGVARAFVGHGVPRPSACREELTLATEVLKGAPSSLLESVPCCTLSSFRSIEEEPNAASLNSLPGVSPSVTFGFRGIGANPDACQAALMPNV